MRCRYREVAVKSGRYLDVKILPVFNADGVKTTRRRKFRPTAEAQARLNEYNSLRHGARIIEENFTESDYMITPTFRDEALPKTDAEFRRLFDNFIRRLRRKYAKAGVELKSFTVIGKSSKGRYHVHMVINGGALTTAQLREVWGQGRLYVSPLEFDENGMTGLGKYMGKHRMLTKRFLHSKNLRIPQAEESDRRYSQREVAATMCNPDDCRQWEKKYPGYRLIRTEPYYNELDGKYYITLRMWKPTATWLRREQQEQKEIAAGLRLPKTTEPVTVKYGRLLESGWTFD